MTRPKRQNLSYRQRKRLANRFETELLVISVLISELQADPNNPRQHPERQFHHLVKSLREFGFIIPILIDEANRILAGHARVEAAKRLGYSEVPAIRVEHLSEVQKKAFMVADNQLVELAAWDKVFLRDILLDITSECPDFDIELTGFQTAEVDLLIDGGAVQLDGADPDDAVSQPSDDVVPTSLPGDVYAMGNHRLVCGDALQADTYDRLLVGEVCQMAFTDAPYNRRARDIGGLGRKKHGDFAMASGEMSEADFTSFLSDVHRLMVAHCRDGAILFSCMDWRHVGEMLSAGTAAGLELKNVCIWVKGNAGMGSFYRSRHEFVFVFKSGEAKHINNFGLGQTGRYRTNVWEYDGVNTFRAGRDEDLAAHPTVKPVGMVADAIRDCSARGGLILDPFAGSGTTILAAERTGRRARCIELDPRYVDVAVQRWQSRTGQEAIHIETGLTFDQLRVQRGALTDQPQNSIRVRHRARPARGMEVADG